MRISECPHVASFQAVKQNDDGSKRYDVTTITDFDLEPSGVDVPCRFIPWNQLRLQDRGMNLEITGNLEAVPGKLENSVMTSAFTDLVILPGSRVTVRGETYLVAGLEPIEDIDGKPIVMRVQLKGPGGA